MDGMCVELLKSLLRTDRIVDGGVSSSDGTANDPLPEVPPSDVCSTGGRS